MAAMVNESLNSLTLVAEAPPLKMDPHGVIRVAGTRVTLETVIGDYLNGASAEEIAYNFPTVSLADIHAVISYYLRHREEMDAYLRHAEEEGDRIQQEMEIRFPQKGLKERLLARRKTTG